MHMADALISPAVGGTMWAVTLSLAALSAHKLKNMPREKVPLMGVLGAFVFAAQMINFTIPMTGSSGHLGGGLLLAVLLGPYAAFLVMFSILSVQALFFADGGLLALGCNVFNLGFWPCFVAYPLIFIKIANPNNKAKILTAAMLAGVIGLQLGAFGVVWETVASGISELPFKAFVLLMQPIHLAIGIVEGAVTAAIISFIYKARPVMLEFMTAENANGKSKQLKFVLSSFAAMAILTGGILSWFASSNPDGLEWAMQKTSGHEELNTPPDTIHAALSSIQKKTAFLPDYDLWESNGEDHWPAVNPGTSLSGLVGGSLVLFFSGITGLSLSLKRRRY